MSLTCDWCGHPATHTLSSDTLDVDDEFFSVPLVVFVCSGTCAARVAPYMVEDIPFTGCDTVDPSRDEEAG